MLNQVLVTENIKSALADFFSQHSFTGIFLLVDEHTEKHCLPVIQDVLPEHWLFCIKPGESYKTLATCEQIWGAMTQAGIDRKALMINLGGGVIGDMGGFCASTYKRGISFINMPTTLLSQVDASVGGKLGIDFQGFKNHIGVFTDPLKVFIDAQFLKTLPERELRSGFAEVIKHGLIFDQTYFDDIKQKGLYRSDWSKVIEASVEIKSAVVDKDPKESGLRKILNFGHTIGHGIETTFLNSEKHLLHGEAIAIGMIMEAYLSTKTCGLSESSLSELSDFLIKVYNPLPIDQDQFEPILENIMQDKKNEGKSIRMSLLKSIGVCAYDIPIGQQDIIDSLFFFNKRLNSK